MDPRPQYIQISPGYCTLNNSIHRPQNIQYINTSEWSLNEWPDYLICTKDVHIGKFVLYNALRKHNFVCVTLYCCISIRYPEIPGQNYKNRHSVHRWSVKSARFPFQSRSTDLYVIDIFYQQIGLVFSSEFSWIIENLILLQGADLTTMQSHHFSIMCMWLIA